LVASIKPQRDELGLADGLMLIDGTWAAAQDGRAAIESYTELKTVLLPNSDEMM
jgi:hypothetical protein